MYFIYDVNYQLFGNPEGYRRYANAQRIATRYRYKLWDLYDEYKEKGGTSNHVWSIEYVEG